MAVSNVPGAAQAAATGTVKPQPPETKNQPAQQPAAATAAVAADTFEKSNAPAAGVYTRDRSAIARLNQAKQAYLDNLQNMVTELLQQVSRNAMVTGEGPILSTTDASRIRGVWDLLVDNGDGTFSFAPNLSAEAQEALRARAAEDLGEDGFWGVNQTSQRILDFAKAVTGGNPAKIDRMREMAQAAFDSAAQMVGGQLPQISRDTYDAVMRGFDEWAAEAGVG